MLVSNADLEQSNQASIVKLNAEIIDLRSDLISISEKASIQFDNTDEAIIGEIRLFAGNFAPKGWAICNGQLLSITNHSALFSILGTIYGGDGRNTFALPDLRGRVAVGVGMGNEQTEIRIGEKFGAQTTKLTNENLPDFSFDFVNKLPIFKVSPLDEELEQGTSALISVGKQVDVEFNNISTAKFKGNNKSISIQPPSIGLNYIIALEGIYPSRN